MSKTFLAGKIELKIYPRRHHHPSISAVYLESTKVFWPQKSASNTQKEKGEKKINEKEKKKEKEVNVFLCIIAWRKYHRVARINIFSFLSMFSV